MGEDKKDEPPVFKQPVLKNAGASISIDEDTKKALAGGEGLEEGIAEPTKYILLDHALVDSVNDNRVKHFTKHLKQDEVLQINDIEQHALLLPVVIKSRDVEVNKRIKKVAELFTVHAHEHRDNMMSLDTKNSPNTAKLLVMALKSDNNPFPSGKELKKMFQ